MSEGGREGGRRAQNLLKGELGHFFLSNRTSFSFPRYLGRSEPKLMLKTGKTETIAGQDLGSTAQQDRGTTTGQYKERSQ